MKQTWRASGLGSSRLTFTQYTRIPWNPPVFGVQTSTITIARPLFVLGGKKWFNHRLVFVADKKDCRS